MGLVDCWEEALRHSNCPQLRLLRHDSHDMIKISEIWYSLIRIRAQNLSPISLVMQGRKDSTKSSSLVSMEGLPRRRKSAGNSRLFQQYWIPQIHGINVVTSKNTTIHIFDTMYEFGGE